MQMKKQSRQIINLFNVVSQLVSSKFKRKLIVIFSSSEDLTFTNTQRVSSKRVVKSTKRAQIIRIEIVKVKRAKIHERSIELLIFLNVETTFLEQKNALFVNKHVSFQTNRIDSFINVFSFTNFSIANLNISNQSSFESIVVVAFDFILAIVFNTFDTFLSLSFIDFVLSFFIENLFSQFTTIILQIFFERTRREIRQQVRNVYSYDLIINQIIKSFFSNAFSTNHLLFYLFTTVNIQISISAIKEIKQERDIDRSRDRSRDNDVEREIST